MVLFVIRLGKRLDNTDADGIFLHIADKRVHRSMQVVEKRNTFPRNKEHDDTDKRQDSDLYPRENGFKGKGDDDTADEQKRCTNAEPLHHAQKAVDVVGIRCKARNKRRNGKIVHLFARKIRNF